VGRSRAAQGPLPIVALPVGNGDGGPGGEPIIADGCLSIDGARAFLGGVSRATVYKLNVSGELAWVKVGRRRVIPRRSLIAFAASRLRGGWADNGEHA
jgi:excisionase family DNA binding protein